MAARTQTPTRSRPGWATTDQAAQHLGVARQTLANWRSQGRGPTWSKRGGVVRYRWADLDAWMSDSP
ncbi:DNA binding domain-containing protein, excisionase family [Thermomonospora echinospora]|uniref:DNA binding domain-containing protein, excisionase family n=1 Tax=Thermomonospora echinospora TaxID=1992 RepID=A0A1H6A744_9ACTN|nr:helix-turn-helix domain-containing protein [Thermomonospora echinospora]SEG44261.1 DNA binding domain-containing protein, excisionase family [Thermomonospora echinospora]